MADQNVAFGWPVALRKRVVVADELGAATTRTYELLTGGTWAKKELILPRLGADSAVLAVRMDCDKDRSLLLLDVNGKSIAHRFKEKRDYWHKGWKWIEVPVSYLRPGKNEFIFRAGDKGQWKLYLENSLLPNRSAKSVDAGQTWDYLRQGVHGSCDGEYIARLSLSQYAEQGVVTSPVIDLAQGLGNEGIASLAKAKKISLTSKGRTPAGTSITFLARAGSTPAYDPATWGHWAPPERAMVGKGKDALYLQWRAVLRSEKPNATPQLKSVALEADVDATQSPTAGRVKVVESRSFAIVRSSYPFAHQHYEEQRLGILREKWGLDKAVAGAKTEFDKILRLRRWARDAWVDGWNKGSILFVPPFDALVILELTQQNTSLGMCTHYSAVFTQACLAMGLNAKVVIIDSHCVAEVWSNEYGKWVIMDTAHDTNDKTKATGHYIRDGVPLNARELRDAYVQKRFEGIENVMDHRMEKPISLEDRLYHYRRFCTTLRNNFLRSIYPEEPEHGAMAYTYDGHVWYEDDWTPRLPQFSITSSRDADFHWSLNQAELHPHLTEKGGEVRVDVATETPNFSHFLVRSNDGEWRERPASFAWRLRRGRNELEVKPVNKFNVEGKASRLVVQYG